MLDIIIFYLTVLGMSLPLAALYMAMFFYSGKPYSESKEYSFLEDFKFTLKQALKISIIVAYLDRFSNIYHEQLTIPFRIAFFIVDFGAFIFLLGALETRNYSDKIKKIEFFKNLSNEENTWTKKDIIFCVVKYVLLYFVGISIVCSAPILVITYLKGGAIITNNFWYDALSAFLIFAGPIYIVNDVCNQYSPILKLRLKKEKEEKNKKDKNE